MGLSVPKELRDTIISWFEARNYVNIRLSLKEIFGKDSEDPNDDYRTKYEISFIPESVSQASIFIIISREGYVGVGIENVKRVEERVGKKISGRVKSAFIFGHQPKSISCVGISTLLNVVSDGKILLCYQHIPMLLFPKIGITKETSDYLVRNEYPYIENFRIIMKEADSNILPYEPWR